MFTLQTFKSKAPSIYSGMLVSYQNAKQKYDIQVEKVRFTKKLQAKKLEMSR